MVEVHPLVHETEYSLNELELLSLLHLLQLPNVLEWRLHEVSLLHLQARISLCVREREKSLKSKNLADNKSDDSIEIVTSCSWFSLFLVVKLRCLSKLEQNFCVSLSNFFFPSCSSASFWAAKMSEDERRWKSKRWRLEIAEISAQIKEATGLTLTPPIWSLLNFSIGSTKDEAAHSSWEKSENLISQWNRWCKQRWSCGATVCRKRALFLIAHKLWIESIFERNNR